jgi:hypothetical protein
MNVHPKMVCLRGQSGIVEEGGEEAVMANNPDAGVLGGPEPDEEGTDVLGGAETGDDVLGGPEPGDDVLGGAEPVTDEFGGSEPDEEDSDTLGGADPA